MKKKVLFVIESLTCAGGEKSLTTLLNLFNYEKYDVELQLFSYGGELEKWSICGIAGSQVCSES